MTMPDERMRSLRWAWELLSTIQQDSSIPSSLKDRARHLAASFPTPETLTGLVEADARELPSGFAVAIDDARTLFEDVRSGGNGSEETKRDILYTLRHFPLAGTTRAATFIDLREWLAAERS